MSCTKFENQIALYVGGDLPAAQASRVASHLAGCAGCRALAEELRAGLALLGELGDDPLEEAMLESVHRRVLAQAASPARPPRRLYWGLAFAAALLLAAILAWPRHPARHTPAPLARVVPPAPRTVPVDSVKLVPVRRRVARRHHRHAPAAEPGPPLLVQFVTDDPNIVIYWLIDRKTQGD